MPAVDRPRRDMQQALAHNSTRTTAEQLGNTTASLLDILAVQSNLGQCLPKKALDPGAHEGRRFFERHLHLYRPQRQSPWLGVHLKVITLQDSWRFGNRRSR